MQYSPEPLSSHADAVATAGGFAALFGHVLRTTVAPDVPIALIPVPREPWTETTWSLSKVDARNVPAPFRLTDGSWLTAGQTLGVRPSSRDGQLWLTTLKAEYQWQAEEDDGTWLVRWHYDREPASGYPRSHIHVNARPSAYDGHPKDFHKLHLPAGRVTVEDVASFLVRERGMPCVSDRWEEVLAEAGAIFARIQGRG